MMNLKKRRMQIKFHEMELGNTKAYLALEKVNGLLYVLVCDKNVCLL